MSDSTLPRTFKSKAALAEASASGVYRGRALHLVIAHDEGTGCTTEKCNCDPWFTIEERTPETYATGQPSQRAWGRGPQN